MAKKICKKFISLLLILLLVASSIGYTFAADSEISITTAIGNVYQTSAHVLGNASNKGTGSITEKGFVYSLKSSPTTKDDKKVVVTSAGIAPFEGDITNLNIKTLYYVRAYIISGGATFYGNEVTFATSSIKLNVTASDLTTAKTGSEDFTGLVTANPGDEIDIKYTIPDDVVFLDSNGALDSVLTLSATLKVLLPKDTEIKDTSGFTSETGSDGNISYSNTFPIKLKKVTGDYLYKIDTGKSLDVKVKLKTPGEKIIKASDSILSFSLGTPQIKHINNASDDLKIRTVDSEVKIDATRNAQASIALNTPLHIDFSQAGNIKVNDIERPKEVVFVVDSSAKAPVISFEQNPLLGFLKYTILSKTVANVKGNQVSIGGGIYAKTLFDARCSGIKIGDAIEAANVYAEGPDMDMIFSKQNKKVTDLNFENLDIYNIILAKAGKVEGSKAIYDKNDSAFSKSSSIKMPDQKDVDIRIESGASNGLPTFVINGSGTFDVKSDMYFKGNLKISLKKVNNPSQGFIMADGDITIQGENASGGMDLDNLYVYSRNGNINFESSHTSFSGIILAPNGEVKVKGDGITFNGSLIGNTISSEASNVNYNGPSDSVINSIISLIPNPPIYDSVKITLGNFIDEIKDRTDLDVGAIRYSTTANSDINGDGILDNDYRLYGCSSDILKAAITYSSADTLENNNLGDALRRANEVLKNSDPLASKYVVVITGSSPNTVSYSDSSLSAFMTGDGDTPNANRSADGESYAKEYAEKLKTDIKAETLFVDLTKVTSTSAISLGNIAKAAGADPDKGIKYFKGQNMNESLKNILKNSVLGYIDGKVETVKLIPKPNVEKAVFEEILPYNVIPYKIKIGSTEVKVKRGNLGNLEIENYNSRTTGGESKKKIDSNIFTLTPVTSGSRTQYKISISLNTDKISVTDDPSDSNAYKVSAPNISMDVLFGDDSSLKPKEGVPVEYDFKNDANIKYTFDSLGEKQFPYKDMTTEVTHTVDIQ